MGELRRCCLLCGGATVIEWGRKPFSRQHYLEWSVHDKHTLHLRDMIGLCLHTTYATVQPTSWHLEAHKAAVAARAAISPGANGKGYAEMVKAKKRVKTKCSEPTCKCKRFVASKWVPERCERCAHLQDKHGVQKQL